MAEHFYKNAEVPMKFEKKKIDGMDGTEVWFTAEEFNIVASRRGVQIKGRSPIFIDLEELRDFAEVIDKAFRAHRDLIPKIERPEFMERFN